MNGGAEWAEEEAEAVVEVEAGAEDEEEAGVAQDGK